MHRRESPIRRGAAVAVTAVAFVAVAGCGGGGSSSDIAFADWQTQADAICVTVRQEAAADQPVTGAGNPAVPIRAAAGVVDSEADRLSDLGKPDKQADTVQDLLDAMTRQVDALNELADVLLVDPTATAGSAGASLKVETDKVDTAAAELGVPSCTTQATTDPSSEPPSSEDPAVDGGFGDQGQTEDN